MDDFKMSDFLVEMIKHQPEWFFTLSAIILLLLLIATAIWVGLGAKRFADGMGRENRIISLQDELSKLKEEKVKSEETTQQLVTAIENAQYHIALLNDIRKNGSTEENISSAIKRIIDAIPSQIKYFPGENHRVALWAAVDNELTFIVGSVGFPEYYNERKLDLDHSVAGKSYRKGEIIIRDNVKDDEDWEQNPHSTSKYKSLICIPVYTITGKWGVLTIDGLKPMTNEIILICKLYCKILEGVLNEYLLLFNNSELEAAYTIEEENQG